MGGNDILMKTLVRNSELMKRYDITPFQMSEWRQQGLVGRGTSYEEDVVELLRRVGKLRQVDPAVKPAKFIEPPASVTIHEAAKMLDASSSRVMALKKDGHLGGGYGMVTIASLESYMEYSNAFMSIPEAARMCDVSSKTIRNWLRDGIIKGSNGRILVNQAFPDKGHAKTLVGRRSRASTEVRVRFSGPRVGSRDYLGGNAYDY